jgi:hypothetical protein
MPRLVFDCQAQAELASRGMLVAVVSSLAHLVHCVGGDETLNNAQQGS